MQQPSDAPISRRLRTIRRRVTATVLATFIAAWLAVAAFGKGGGTTSTPAVGSSQPPAAAGQSDDGSLAPQDGDEFGGGPGDENDPDSGADQGYGDSGQSQGRSQSSPSDPVTTSQS
jgi:hypothetical protein